MLRGDELAVRELVENNAAVNMGDFSETTPLQVRREGGRSGREKLERVEAGGRGERERAEREGDDATAGEAEERGREERGEREGEEQGHGIVWKLVWGVEIAASKCAAR